ncbi:similar to stage IV sporulation protein [Clostridium sp. CAG:524]|nr:similar to stage IV sporulation protein [Clostridium sp. CAG:524]
MNKVRIVVNENSNKFLNYLIYNKIYYDSLNKYNEYFVLDVSYDDYLYIRRRYKCHIVKYYGKKNIVNIYENNKYVLLSLIISFMLLFLLCNTIFDIKINSDDKDIVNIINDSLKDNGIGVYKRKVSFDKLNSIKNKILEDNKDTLEWIEIREKGCIYYIDVTPRVKSNNNVDNSLPSDIVAEKDGVIKHIVVHRGSKVIDNGDYVKKGDILISGNIIKNENVIDKVHSEGVIYAETWKTVNISIPFKRIDYVYKKTINHYYLDIFGHKFTISGKYDSDNTINKKSIVLDKPYLFFKLYKEEKKIYDYNEVILNKEEAYNEALNRSIDIINKKLSSDEYIISKKVLKKEVKRSKINLEVFFKVYEKIGVTSEIQDIGEENGEYN